MEERERNKAQEMFVRTGTYIIEEAYVVTADRPRSGIALRDAFLDVEKEGNRTIVHGRATVHNLSLVQLLEDYERLDMVINMGEGFKFYLREPIIQAGKVFSPKVESTMRFIPTDSFDPMTEEEYLELIDSIALLRHDQDVVATY
ncbi:MAG: hypothetical protein N2260_02790 [Syntrophobacterales bacterium]|nr:hypothetical protein [Syntrophobacterales bacterium]